MSIHNINISYHNGTVHFPTDTKIKDTWDWNLSVMEYHALAEPHPRPKIWKLPVQHVINIQTSINTYQYSQHNMTYSHQTELFAANNLCVLNFNWTLLTCWYWERRNGRGCWYSSQLIRCTGISTRETKKCRFLLLLWKLHHKLKFSIVGHIARGSWEFSIWLDHFVHSLQEVFLCRNFPSSSDGKHARFCAHWSDFSPWGQ